MWHNTFLHSLLCSKSKIKEKKKKRNINNDLAVLPSHNTLLLLVLSMFLTAISLSSFCSLNSCFATILSFIKIFIALLSKSTFTIILLWMSIFSNPIFNYTSLSILKVLLTSLWLPFSFSVSSGAFVHALLCCASPSLRYVLFLSSFFRHSHHFSSSNFLLKITPCSSIFFYMTFLLPILLTY